MSIDGRCATTLHFPPNKAAPTTLEKGAANALLHACELADTSAFECFIFDSTTGDIDVEITLRAAGDTSVSGRGAATNKLDLPDRYRQFSFMVEKVAP